jgi:protein arginine kinase activator
VVHIHQVSGAEEIHLHLCEDCAAHKGISSSEKPSELSVSHLLADLLEANGSAKKIRSKKICPQCGMTLRELKSKRKVGCNECFSTFAAEIRNVVHESFGKVQHRGKYPLRVQSYKMYLLDIQNLKKKLQKAVREEDYEKAAKLRDKIEELKSLNR